MKRIIFFFAISLLIIIIYTLYEKSNNENTFIDNYDTECIDIYVSDVKKIHAMLLRRKNDILYGYNTDSLNLIEKKSYYRRFNQKILSSDSINKVESISNFSYRVKGENDLFFKVRLDYNQKERMYSYISQYNKEEDSLIYNIFLYEMQDVTTNRLIKGLAISAYPKKTNYTYSSECFNCNLSIIVCYKEVPDCFCDWDKVQKKRPLKKMLIKRELLNLADCFYE